MKTLFLCLIVASLFAGKNTNLSTKDSDITNCDILEEVVLCLKKALPNYEEYAGGNRPFSVDCKKGEVIGFNIYDMLDTANYIEYTEGNFKVIPNHLYHIHAWDYAFCTSNLMYMDEEGNITFFEAINCSNRGSSLKEVEEFIHKTVTDEDKRNELLKILPSYREFGYYMQVCGLASILDCDEN